MSKFAKGAQASSLMAQGKGTDWDTILSTILINLLGLAIPIAMLQLFDRVIPNQSFATLHAIFVLLIAVVCCDSLLKMLRGQIMLANEYNLERRVMWRAIDRLFAGAPGALRKIGSDGIVERLSSVQRLSGLSSCRTAVRFLDIGFAFVLLGAIWLLTGPLVLVPVAMIGIVAIMARGLRTRHREAVETRESNDTRRLSFLIEVLQQVKLLKLFGAEQTMLRRYDMLHNSSASANETLVRISDVSFTMSAMLGQATTGLTSLCGAWLVIGDQIGLADLAAAILMTARAVQPFISAFFADAERSAVRLASDNLDQLLTVPDTMTAPTAPVAKEIAIALRNVRLSRSGWGEARIAQAEIPRTGITLVTGHDSCDPGLLLEALAGETRDFTGEIAQQRPTQQGRPSCAYLPTEPRLLTGSLLANLTNFHGRTNMTERTFWATRLGVMEDATLLPGGLEADFQGQDRSVGSIAFQKKLDLARCLGQNASILIMDRPFAMLDPGTSHRLTQALIEISQTTAVIVTQPSVALREHAIFEIALCADEDARCVRLKDNQGLSTEYGRTNIATAS